MYTMNYENYDPCFPDQPVVDQYLPIWANLPVFRSKPAFIWAEDGLAGESSALTYAQLNLSAQSISHHLLSRLQRGDTVVILCSPGLQLVEIIFGCQRAGLLAVPVIPPHPSNFASNHHLLRVLSQTKPKAAITHSDYIKHLGCNKQLLLIRTEEMMMMIDKKQCNLSSSPYNGCRADEVYLVQYTSGATGIPKPVLVTAGSAAHNVRAARKAYDLHPNSVIVSWLPQYHDCGLMFLLLTVVSGATCVLTSPTAFINRPRLWLELITEFKATCTPVPSFTLPLVVRRGGINGLKATKPINLSSMKNLIVINEPIYKASVEEFIHVFTPFGLNPASLSPSYGLAENCTFVSTAWTSSGNNVGFPNYNKLLPSARLSNWGCRDGDEEEEEIDIIIVNEETCEAVEDGVEGEIWVSSPSNAMGYLGHPSLTREVFQARLSNHVSRRFVRTGDRGVVIGQERYLYVTGRCSDIIKLPNAQQITHPHYIETAAYNSCPQFLRGGCIAAFMVSRTVVAVVAEMQRISGEEGEIGVLMRKVCDGIREGVVKEENVEVGLVVLVKSGSVPKTTSGKIQRWAAMDKLLRGQLKVLMVQMQFGKGSDQEGEKGSADHHDHQDQTEGILLSHSHTPIHLPFLCSL